METKRKNLLYLYWIPVALSLLTVLLGESDIFPCGILAENKSSEFMLSTLMILLTIGAIPLALRMFKLKHVQQDFSQETNFEHAYMKWSTCRLLLLSVPMLVNTLLYYLYMRAGFGYLAIILLLSLCFVYPSKARIADETGSHNSQL